MIYESYDYISKDGVVKPAGCSVVIVSFHSFGKLPACLKALRKSGSFGQLEVTVVNNSSDDNVEIIELCNDHGATFVQSGSNIGYGSACNLGAQRAKAKYVLFLNPDVIISQQSVDMLLDLADANPEIVALGPIQSNSKGRIYGKRRVTGSPRRASNTPIRKILAPSALVNTDFISGGAIMVRKDAFDSVGGFDRDLFLFHEDDDLCLKLAAHGRIAYAAGVVALHDGGASTPPSMKITYARSWHLGFSKVQLLRKHYGNRAALAVLLESVLKIISPAMLTSRGRTKAKAFLSGTLAALKNSDVQTQMVPA